MTILNCIKLPVLRAFFGGPIGLKKIQNATFTPIVGAEIGPAPQHFFNCISFNLDLKKKLQLILHLSAKKRTKILN